MESFYYHPNTYPAAASIMVEADDRATQQTSALPSGRIVNNL